MRVLNAFHLDLGFELFVGLSFAWDPPESKDGLMRLKPRKPVTERSILSLKKRALRRTKTLRRDSETQTLVKPSRFRQLLTKCREPFTRTWWEDRFEKTENETLVDGKLLSYSYLEAGVIEFAAWYVWLCSTHPMSFRCDGVESDFFFPLVSRVILLSSLSMVSQPLILEERRKLRVRCF